MQSAKSIKDITEYLTSDDAMIDRIGLFLLIVRNDPLDSSSYGLTIASTPLSLDDADEYASLTENGKRIKKAEEEKVAYMLGRIGMQDDEAKAVIEGAQAFETTIAGSMMGTMASNDPDSLEKTLNRVTLDDIKKIEGDVPLTAFMEKYGYAKSDKIILLEPDWLKGLASAYTEDNVESIKAYILSSLARNYIDRTDEEAFREYQRISNEKSGLTESQPDEELAYTEAKELFPYCFDRLYVDKYVTESMRGEIRGFCEESIDSYREMLSQIDWMSDETKKEAINKLDHIAIHAVYPDKWEDDSVYDIKSKEDGGSYLMAQQAFSRGMLEKDIAKINTKVDRDIWDVDILEANAFYNPANNSINIIPGYFCDVTYREDMSVEEKYGAIGSVIGHEISHAFDTSGSQYDADGNVFDWWAPKDKEEFRKRAKKLVDYFDNVVAFDDGTPYSGQMVQTEAIADIAGLKCMLTLAKKVDGFDYDKFFRANAKLWARVYTVEKCEEAVLTDTHPIHYLRTNVTLPQFDEFIETYDIKEGDGMYFAPEDRIAVW